MAFLARYDFIENNLQGRAYLHSSGSNIFLKQEALDYDFFAGIHMAEVLRRHGNLINTFSFEYFLAVIWGDLEQKTKVVDFFGYKDIFTWPGNPDVVPIIFRNGSYSLSDVSTCEDSIILLGEEAKMRRSCRSIDDYLGLRPSVDDLNNIVSSVSGRNQH